MKPNNLQRSSTHYLPQILNPFPKPIVNPRKLEHGFRRIRAGIPYTLPSGQEENDVPTFWLLLYPTATPKL